MYTRCVLYVYCTFRAISMSRRPSVHSGKNGYKIQVIIPPKSSPERASMPALVAVLPSDETSDPCTSILAGVFFNGPRLWLFLSGPSRSATCDPFRPRQRSQELEVGNMPAEANRTEVLHSKLFIYSRPTFRFFYGHFNLSCRATPKIY